MSLEDDIEESEMSYDSGYASAIESVVNKIDKRIKQLMKDKLIEYTIRIVELELLNKTIQEEK